MGCTEQKTERRIRESKENDCAVSQDLFLTYVSLIFFVSPFQFSIRTLPLLDYTKKAPLPCSAKGKQHYSVRGKHHQHKRKSHYNFPRSRNKQRYRGSLCSLRGKKATPPLICFCQVCRGRQVLRRGYAWGRRSTHSRLTGCY